MFAEQLAPGATELPQLFTREKSAALAPVIATPAMFKTALPLFVNVTFWGGLALPTTWFPNERLELLIVMPGEVPCDAGSPPVAQEAHWRTSATHRPAKTTLRTCRWVNIVIPCRTNFDPASVLLDWGNCSKLARSRSFRQFGRSISHHVI